MVYFDDQHSKDRETNEIDIVEKLIGRSKIGNEHGKEQNSDTDEEPFPSLENRRSSSREKAFELFELVQGGICSLFIDQLDQVSKLIVDLRQNI